MSNSRDYAPIRPQHGSSLGTSPVSLVTVELEGLENNVPSSTNNGPPQSEPSTVDNDEGSGFIDVFADLDAAPLNPSGYETGRFGPSDGPVSTDQQLVPSTTGSQEVSGLTDIFAELDEAPLNPSGYEAERFGPRSRPLSAGPQARRTVISMADVVDAVLSPPPIAARSTQGRANSSSPETEIAHFEVGNPWSQRWGGTVFPPPLPVHHSDWRATLPIRAGAERRATHSAPGSRIEASHAVLQDTPTSSEELPLPYQPDTAQPFLGPRNDENVERPWMADIAREGVTTNTIHLREFEEIMEAVLRISHRIEDMSRDMRQLLTRLVDIVLAEIDARVNEPREEQREQQ